MLCYATLHRSMSHHAQALIQSLNASGEPVLMVGCAGGTDALSGTASYLATPPPAIIVNKCDLDILYVNTYYYMHTKLSLFTAILI